MIDNLLKYPTSCIVGKVIPKTTFARHFDSQKVRREMKQHFAEDIDSIVWLYKVAESTCNIEPIDDMKEIQVFLVNLKNRYCPDDLVNFIDQNMPQFIVFILKYEDEYRLLINYKQWTSCEHTAFNITSTYRTDFLPSADLNLPMQGKTTAQVYDNFVAIIAGIDLEQQNSLHEVVEKEQQRKKLLADIAALEKAIRKEPQYNRQLELNQRLKQLRKELQQL